MCQYAAYRQTICHKCDDPHIGAALREYGIRHDVCDIHQISCLTPNVLLSPIVVAEIYAGAFKREYEQIEGFFKLCTILSLDIETARLAGIYAHRYRKSHRGISLEDYLLAATAGKHHCLLWTGNRRHYPMPEIALFDD